MTVFATWTNMASHSTQTVVSRLYVVPRAQGHLIFRYDPDQG